MTRISSINKRTLTEEAYEILKRAILSHHYPPGTVLNEVELARALNVSPTPIREAFHRLRADGLVVYEPWKGTRVVELSDEDIVALFDVRLALENLALTQSIDKLSEAEKAALRSIIKEFPTPGTERDTPENHLEHDRNFHGFFRERSNSSWLIRMLDNLSSILYLIRYPSSGTRTSNEATYREHLAIAEAALKGDVSAAKDAMARHMNRVMKDVIVQRSKNNKEHA